MNLQDLKNKQPEELLKQADKLEIENPSSLRKQDLMFAILKKIANDGEIITGLGVIEIMQDVLDFYVHPNQTIYQGQMIFMFLLHKLKNSALELEIVSKGKLEHQNKVKDILL